MGEIQEYNEGRVVSMTLSNAACCQITEVRGEEGNDPRAPATGFMVRVWEPWGVYPGEPDEEGGFKDGTGHNLDTLSFTLRYRDDGTPHLQDLLWTPRCFRARGAPALIASEEAERLTARAAKLREEAGVPSPSPTGESNQGEPD